MEEKKSFKEVIDMIHSHKKEKDFYTIMDEYFDELHKYHPQTYSNLMKEIYKLGAQTNILDGAELSKYIKHIHHKDMPELWTVEQTTKVGKEIGIDFDEWKYNIYTFNYIMNMMRADYYAEFKKMFATSPLMKQTILDSASFYAHMAKAWLDDEDAPANKALWYIKFVSGEIKCTEEDK